MYFFLSRLTLANSAVPDEMPHNEYSRSVAKVPVRVNKGLKCVLLRKYSYMKQE